jgi:hypothetical protein
MACPPPRIVLTFNTQNENLKVIEKEKYGEIKPFLIYNNDSLIINFEAEIADYNLENHHIHRSLYIEMYLNSKLGVKFKADSIYIIDSKGYKLYPHGHSIYHKDNFYKKNDKHELGIVFRSYKHPLTLPVDLYLPKVILIKGNSIINKFDFQKIELNANRNNGK